MARLLCALLCVLVVVDGAKTTPMEKVIGLLKGLSEKVAAEGKKDAAEYDKYACFCKDQASDKLYAIDKSDKKIEDLKAEITKLGADISALDTAVGELDRKATARQDEIDAKTVVRDKQHAEYLVKNKDHQEAIDACASAIEALENSKKNLKGNAKLNLVQLTKAMAKIGQAPPTFEYQSNDIISTLQDLLRDFHKMKKELDLQEFDVKSIFDKEVLGLTNEKKFAIKERDEKAAISASKTEDLEEAKKDGKEEQDQRDSDQNFLDELTTECEKKAKQFDERSSTRADELVALAEATRKMEEGAAPNESANKKLVGLIQKKETLSSSPVSFAQINTVQHTRAAQTLNGAADRSVKQLLSFLSGAADRIDSRLLSTLAVRVKVAEDHFVKVRGLINDLITKLEADAAAEATQKSFCDKAMGKAISERDEGNQKIEACNANLATLNSKEAELKDEVQTLQAQVAELKKALLEATELREKEKEENEKTILMATDGEHAVNGAIEVMNNFYNNAFIQTKYTPPKADRDGNTVGDLAPKVDEEYHGAKAESKGIVGIMEVILADFQRTVRVTTEDERDAQADFETFEKESTGDITTKETRVTDAEGEILETKAKILGEEQALADANDLLDGALKSLEDLQAECVAGEETWEERKAKREAEVEALKEAQSILENWQGF